MVQYSNKFLSATATATALSYSYYVLRVISNTILHMGDDNRPCIAAVVAHLVSPLKQKVHQHAVAVAAAVVVVRLAQREQQEQ